MGEKIPRHIAIILDGNRRWARKKGMPATAGHRWGAKTLEKTIENCLKRKIKFLTAYVFSTENWQRSPAEVKALMALFEEYIKRLTPKLHKNKIRLNIFGELKDLPESLQHELAKAIKITKNNKKLVLNLALNYGGRSEITQAVKSIFKNKKAKISERSIEKNLYSAGMPDPDLVIRTGGEKRLSNFLLWQVAYSELYFTDIYWPDFNARELDKAIKEWQRRQRRFGK